MDTNRGIMKRILLMVSLLFGMVLSLTGPLAAADSCTDCHAKEGRMKDAGYPQFTVTAAEVRIQTLMTAACSDCHLGDPQAKDKVRAHQELLTMRVFSMKGDTTTRAGIGGLDGKDGRFQEPRGPGRATTLAPKVSAGSGTRDNSDYPTILYHDKNPDTLAFNPVIAEKTCGKCHPEQVRGFLRTAMGGGSRAHTQSQYVFWTSAAGPQSCGLWLGKLTKPDQAGFTPENVKIYRRHATASIAADTAYAGQRNCNQCHVGCLDCHFSPQKKDAANPRKGQHTFVRKPDALACYGGGRSFNCHAGPMELRRGDGYLRGEFTRASEQGKRVLKDLPDIHAGKGVACIDCHEQNAGTTFHADLKRQGGCVNCHPKTVANHATGIHRKVDCAGCHTTLIGGYAFNFWTLGSDHGKENPVMRIQDYYADAMPPVLVRNPSGIWIPVHVVPHTSGNVKAGEVKLSKGLVFRNRPDASVERRYPSNDSFAVTGLVRNLDSKDRDTMVWLNVDRVAHATGRSRPCGSCHASTAQKVTTGFSGGSYRDVRDGSYSIIADGKGLRITDFKGPGGGPPPSGLAPLLTKWGVKGDFSLPPIREKNLYRKLEQDYRAGIFEH